MEIKKNWLVLSILASCFVILISQNLLNISYHNRTIKKINKMFVEFQDVQSNTLENIKSNILRTLDENRNIIVKDTKELFFFNSTAHLIAKFLKIYKAYDKNGPIELKRYGKNYDGGYVVAEKAFDAADVLLGYGIDTDISFEESFSIKYQKPSYGFDCGTNSTNSSTPLFTFISECIGSDKSLYAWQNSSTKISSFKQQLDRLKLENKRLFIKMDIEGSEYEVFNEILQYQNNITGIALEVHFESDNSQVIKALKLLRDLSKNFVLVHVHCNNHCLERFVTTNVVGQMTRVIELSYINKSLVTNYYIAEDQSHPNSLDMPNDQTADDVHFEILP